MTILIASLCALATTITGIVKGNAAITIAGQMEGAVVLVVILSQFLSHG